MAKTVDELASRWLPGAELGTTEQRVFESTIARHPLARDVGLQHEQGATPGERLADSIARIGGSWSFIIGFGVFLVLWTVGNGYLLVRDAFDPYPFIFLNLILSMLAAIQAPVIMMSQNRQASHDRLDAAHDYEVNLKAEIEIMALHEKMDEMRQTEIRAMHRDVIAMSERLARMEAQIASGKPAS
jgi:uncharacterized membrane protein